MERLDKADEECADLKERLTVTRALQVGVNCRDRITSNDECLMAIVRSARGNRKHYDTWGLCFEP